MNKHWAVVLPLLVAGCAQPSATDPNITINNPPPADSGTGPVVYTPATPKGTVSGQVLDTSMRPLAGATVKLTLGSASADAPYTTQADADGNFLFTGVPAGSQVLVTVSKSGYATLRATATVPASAGSVPIDNGNANVGALALVQTQSSVRITLLTPSGLPAVGAQAYLEAVPAGVLAFNTDSVMTTSSVVATPVRADASGVVTFTNVPSPAELARIGGSAGGYRLWVDPVDVNGDGILEAAGYADKDKILASDLVVSAGSRTVHLGVPVSDSSGGTAFGLASTNLPSLQYVKLADSDPAKAQTELLKKPMRNLLRVGDPIYLSFSQPVAPGSLMALLADETGKQQVDLTATANSTGDTYTLMPSSAAVKDGQEYNLILRASSAYTGAVKTWKGFFTAGDPKAARAPQLVSVTFRDGTSGTAGALDPGECVILTFNQLVTATSVQLDVTLSTGTDSTTLPFKALPAAPPQSTSCFTSDLPLKFPIDTANFNDATTRFSFTYGLSSSGYPVLQPGTARARVDFSGFLKQEPSAYYESAWGTPILASTVSEVVLSR